MNEHIQNILQQFFQNDDKGAAFRQQAFETLKKYMETVTQKDAVADEKDKKATSAPKTQQETATSASSADKGKDKRKKAESLSSFPDNLLDLFEKNMLQSVLLNEILAPPVALRDNDEEKKKNSTLVRKS